MKKCPKCGEMMAADVNFCTNCGTDLRQVAAAKPEQPQPVETQPTQEQPAPAVQQTQTNAAPTQPTRAQMQQNQQVAAQPSGFANYWAWIVASWKKPTVETKSEKWYGIVNLAIEIVLILISCWKMLQNGITALTNGLNSSAVGSFFSNSANQAANQQTGNIIGRLLVFLVIATVVMIGLSMAGYTYAYKRHADVMSYINRIAQYSNYLLIINIVILLLAFMGVSLDVVLFFILLAILVFTLATIAPVLMDNDNVQDKVIGGLIAIAGLLISIFVFRFMLNSLIQSIGGSLTSFFK